MATMASKAPTEMPTFSYAQAAKGFSSPAPTQPSDSTKPAQPSDQNKSKSQLTVNGTDSSKEQSTTFTDASTSMETSGDQDKSQSMEGKVPTKDSLTVSTDAHESTKNTVSGATSPSYGTASSVTLPKDDDMSFTPNGSSDSTWDKQSQISAPAGNVDQASEAGAEKSSENGGGKTVPTAKELKAAPIPAVNVWQQRMETQNAKSRTSVISKPNGTHTSKGAAKGPNASQQTPSDLQSDNSKGGNKKKFGNPDGGSEGKERRKPADAGKSKEDSTIPPVGDSASWPTPQLAQGEEKRKAQEKTDKGDKGDKERNPVTRTHGKDKWMPVPYVPTAVFNTPLPPVARRGGGRPARGGGREGATRGRTHGPTPSVGGDKTATGNQTSSPKQSTPSDRGRHESSTQTESVAQGRRHTSADAATSLEQRKTSQSHQFGNDTKFAKGLEGNQNGAPHRHDHSQLSGSEALPKHRQDVRSFSRTQDSSTFSQKGSDQTPRHVSLQGDHNGPSRYGTSRERRFDSGPRSAAAEFFREPSGSFSARDRDHTRDRGDSRPERGRGGYRGRGGHSTFTGSQNSQYHMYQQGNHTYQPPKPYINDRHRPGPQNGTQPQNPNQRLNLRSPSLPNSAMYNSYPVPADFNTMYGYPPMHPGPMSAIPYQPYLEPFSLISMISMQLEYYFSVDNLCKDMFLRKHMDSQGFVPLNVIASFKRIKSLTEDIDLLRHVCRQIKGVEYRQGEDGVDRLRKREKWEQWVLSMEMRDPSAQNEGPPPPSYSPIPVDGMNGNHFPTNNVDEFTAPLTNGTAHHASAPLSGLSNGVNGTHVSKTPLSSTAPEFSPLGTMNPQGQDMNGGKTGGQNNFPDEQIENLVIVVRKPGFSSPPQPTPLNPTSCSFSSGLIDGCRTTAGIVTPKELPSNLIQAGTTSSKRTEPSQLEDTSRNTPSSPMSSGDSLNTEDSMSTFWVKDKDAPIEILPSDLLHESYHVFRKRAIEERESNTNDDGHRDMDVLYQFWSHFLIRNFNAGMYSEFKSLAFDDVSSKRSTRGLDHLIRFHDATLANNRTISDEVAEDLITVIKTESAGDGEKMFQRLRSAWKNTALNPNTREKIDRVLDEDLRAELEK